MCRGFVVDLAGGYSFAFTARRIGELEAAGDAEIAGVEIVGAAFGLH